MAVDVTLERAHQQGTPLVDGDTATFVWEGDQPPQLIGDFNGFGWREPRPQASESSPGVWTHTLPLVPDTYLEYAYRLGEDNHLDPLNPRTVSNGVGGFHSYFWMPPGEDTSLARRRRGILHGKVTRHVVENDFMVVGRRRRVYLYRPPTDEPCPLLVVFDGQDYLRRARLPDMVDNLIAEGRIRPIAMAMVQHGNQARVVEYNCSEATLTFVLHSVGTLAREKLNLIDIEERPGAFGVLGASMGGLMSLYTGLRVPHVFGHVISQSGAFGIDLSVTPSVVEELVRCSPPRSLSIYLGVGRYEFLRDGNRRMSRLLREYGYQVHFQEFPGAHNYTSWKNDVWRGLEAVFPPGR